MRAHARGLAIEASRTSHAPADEWITCHTPQVKGEQSVKMTPPPPGGEIQPPPSKAQGFGVQGFDIQGNKVMDID